MKIYIAATIGVGMVCLLIKSTQLYVHEFPRQVEESFGSKLFDAFVDFVFVIWGVTLLALCK